MKKNALLLALALTLQLSGFAQPACTGAGRYVDSVFACVDISSDIQFGTGVKDWGWGNLFCLDLTVPPYNTQIALRCDVYEPCGDTLAARPLIIAIHGGAWAAGNKADFAAYGEFMAKKGYVVASINYRLSVPANPLCWNSEVDSIKLYRACVRGIQDSKAAVRYFRENADVFRIDPDYIFALGASAGAFNALGVGYLDLESERPGACDAQPQYGEWLGNLLLPDMGSVEGNGGNPDQPSGVRAVVSLSGAVTDPSAFNGPSTPPLLVFHGDADDVVPYGYDCALEGLIDQGLFDECIRVYGPEVFVPQAQAAGVSVEFVTFPGGGHGYTEEEIEAIYFKTTDFFCEQMWSAVAAKEELVEKPVVTLFPNPVSGRQVHLRTPEEYAGERWQFFDLSGRMITQIQIVGENQELRLPQTPPGFYVWRISGTSVSGKLVLE